MALFPALKLIVDDFIKANGIQAITGDIHNFVEHELIDAVGAPQVYVNPLITDNPGTPENARAYIALPGTYANFLTALATPAVITAPLGVIQWSGGPYWTVKQLPIATGNNFFFAVTTSALTSGTPYTTVNIAQSNGGFTAYAGTWVRLVNQTTGRADYVQLTIDLAPSDTSITFKSRTIITGFPIGSGVEVFPVIGMRWWAEIPVSSAGINFVDLPATWRPPPVEAVQLKVYMENMRVTKNSFECSFDATPTEEFEFKLHATTRTRIIFGTNLEAGEIIRVWVLQPAVLEVAS